MKQCASFEAPQRLGIGEIRLEQPVTMGNPVVRWWRLLTVDRCCRRGGGGTSWCQAGIGRIGGVPPREVGEIVVSDDGGVVRGDELVDKADRVLTNVRDQPPGVFATDVSTDAALQDQRATGPASTRG